MVLELRCGADQDLEEAATNLLMADRAEDGGRKPGDWLSLEQLKMREGREVLNIIGTVGEYLRYRGLMYHRAYNPHLNNRPTIKDLNRPGMDPWNQLAWENVGNVWFKAGWWKPYYRGEEMDDGSRFHRRFYP